MFVFRVISRVAPVPARLIHRYAATDPLYKSMREAGIADSLRGRKYRNQARHRRTDAEERRHRHSPRPPMGRDTIAVFVGDGEFKFTPTIAHRPRLHDESYRGKARCPRPSTAHSSASATTPAKRSARPPGRPSTDSQTRRRPARLPQAPASADWSAALHAGVSAEQREDGQPGGRPADRPLQSQSAGLFQRLLARPQTLRSAISRAPARRASRLRGPARGSRAHQRRPGRRRRKASGTCPTWPASSRTIRQIPTRTIAPCRPTTTRSKPTIAQNDHFTATYGMQFHAVTEGDRVIKFALLPTLRVEKVTSGGQEISFHPGRPQRGRQLLCRHAANRWPKAASTS